MGRLPRGPASSFLLRRMGSSKLLLGSIFLSVLICSGLAAALVTFGTRSLPAAAQREFLRSGSTSIDVSAQLTAPLAAAGSHLVTSAAAAAFGPAPVTVDRGLWSDPFRLAGHSLPGIQVQAQAAAMDAIGTHAVLTSGAWPGPAGRGQPIPAAVPAPTAAILGVRTGDLLAVHDGYSGALVRLRITGVFQPRDPAGQYWGLSLLGTSGASQTNAVRTYGPLVVSPTAFESGALPAIQASWVVLPQVTRIPVNDYSAVAGRVRAAQQQIEYPPADNGDDSGLTATTGMPQILDASASGLTVARSVLLVGALQLLLIAAAAIALAAQRLAGQREEESALLSARGMARRQLAVRAAGEAVLLAVIPAAAGAVAGSRLAAARVSSALHTAAGATTIPASIWWTAGAIVAGCTAIMLWPILSPAQPGTASVRRGRQVSLAGTARAGADIALIGLGALALWQLRLFTAAPRSTTGSLGVYPVLAIAPALALAGAAIVLLRGLPAVARLLDRTTARTRRLTAALAGWQVSRRPLRQSGPALLVVLAVAAGTLALGEHQSWLRSTADQAAFAAGADVRVDLPAPLPLGQAGRIARARGVTAAMPAARFGYDDGGEVLAINARQAAATVLLRPDLAAQPASQLWRKLSTARPGPGLELPGRPARLQLTATLGPASLAAHIGPLAASLSVQDADGIVYSVPAGSLTAGRHRLVARLAGASQGSYPLRLLAVTLSYPLPPVHHSGVLAVTVSSLAVSAAGSGPFPAPFARGSALGGWQRDASSPALQSSISTLPRKSAALPASEPAPPAPAGSVSAAFTPGFGAIKASVGAVPLPAQLTLIAPVSPAAVNAIGTDTFLSRNSLNVGQRVAVTIGTVQVTATIVAAVREFPTISDAQGGGLILDQTAVQDELAAVGAPPLPVTEWWLATAAGPPAGLPAGTVSTVRAALAATLLADPLNRAQQLALVALTIAAALLAALGFSVSVAGSMRERRTQSALLAALGVNRAAQARQLCLEQLMLSGPAAAAGLLLGAGLAWLLVPAVTLTATGLAPVPSALVQLPLAWSAALALAVTVIPVLAAAVTVAYRPDPAAQLRAAAAL
jgi:hypothetical protein